MVVERPVRSEVEAGVPFAHRFVAELRFAGGVQRVRQAVQEKGGRLFEIAVAVRRIGVIQRGAQQHAAVPDVRFGLVFAGAADQTGLDRIELQQPVGFRNHHPLQVVAVLLREEVADRIHAVGHAFQPQHADPVVSPLSAVGGEIMAGQVGRHRVAQQFDGGRQNLVALHRQRAVVQVRRGTEHRQRREDVAVALGRPVRALPGPVTGQRGVECRFAQERRQLGEPRFQEFEIAGSTDVVHDVALSEVNTI